jgi:hypothetical protein
MGCGPEDRTMPFMIPEYLVRRAWLIDTKDEGILPFFASTPFDEKGGEEEELVAWFADLLGKEETDIYSVERDDYPRVYVRLSAPGYMDATDWSGFNTESEARAYVVEQYDVDADTGVDLNSDED